MLGGVNVIYLYLLSTVGLAAYLTNILMPKSFVAFLVIFAGINTIGYFAYSYLVQLKERNSILRGKFQAEIQNEKIRLQEVDKNLKELEIAIKTLAEEKTKGFPWLAKAYADYLSLQDEKSISYLKYKSRPAHSAAEIVKQVKQEKRQLIEENKRVSYIIEYYEGLFPWLVDLKDIDNDDLTVLVESQEQNGNSGLDMASKWLTEKEYSNLTSIDKYQKALDRYQASKKSKWQIGRDFERYIGYQYEQQGYTVEYRGIVDGFEDLGRDLICKTKDKIHIVQCKYWSQHKIIHEKHINQLLGTTIMYYLQMNPSSKTDVRELSKLLGDKKIVPVFVTSTVLSDTARQFAATLGVELRENVVMGQYPLVKCNINPATKEKIYHLPFDQQYDKTMINGKGECYAWTVKEAESKGFRRAMRWYGVV